MAQAAQAGGWPTQVVPTGVPNLDPLIDGGLTRGSLVLIVGGPGTGKTVLAEQMAFHWAKGRHKVLWVVTPGEPNEKFLTHLAGMRFFDSHLVGDTVQVINLSRYLEQGRQAQMEVIRQTLQGGGYGFVIIDGFQNVRCFLGGERDIRLFLSELGSELALMGITVMITADASPERYWESPEFTMADTILALERVTVEGCERRQVHVLKQRGRSPCSGVHSYTIDAGGLHVHPRIEVVLEAGDAPVSTARCGFGLAGLDQMLYGGLLQGSSTLLVGGPGTGKTALACQFLAEGVRQGQQGLYLSFFESPALLLRRADAFGMPLRQGYEAGLLHMRTYPLGCFDPDACIEEAKVMIEERQVRRLVVDGFDPVERALGPAGRVVDFAATLTRYLAWRGVTSILTYELPEMAGGPVSLQEPEIGQVTGNIILLRQSRTDTRRQRLLSVLKTRHSEHSDAVAELLMAEGRLQVITDPAAVKQQAPDLVPVAFRDEPQAGHYY